MLSHESAHPSPNAARKSVPDAQEPIDPNAPAHADHEWIRRAQAGDETAFQELVERHQERAFRVAVNLVANREDARDLAQDAFIRVFKNLARFDFKHEFTTWLYRIVTNLAIDHLRKRRPHVRTQGGPEDDPIEFDLEDEGAEAPSAELEREETAVRVRDCIDRLAPHFRVVMILRELEGLPCTDIAEIVGATHVTVRWRLHRGRKLFQEEWERAERLRSGEAGTNPANTSSKPRVDAPGDTGN